MQIRPELTALACLCAVFGIANGQERISGTGAADLVALGRRLFTEATFDGNGRVCSTCHELDGFGTITPEHVQALWEADPGGVLFRAIDSDDGRGVSYERLLEHATMRIPIELPTRTVSGLGVRLCDTPEQTTVYVNRGNPTVFNVALERHLMHDGRDGDDLEQQARNAVETHAQPKREPTERELRALAAFQAQLFSHAAIARTASPAGALTEGTGLALTLPDGNTPAEIRGRAFFEPDRQCGLCHSGPMLNRSSRFHPNGVGLEIESSFVGAEPDNPNEKHEWCYVDLATNELAPGPNGVPEVFQMPVSDPGIGLVAGIQEFQAEDGRPQFIPNEVLVAVAGPVFKIPTLWGTPDTAPYFHDNSAKTLADVLDQYNFVFSFFEGGAFRNGCHPEPTACLSEQDKADIVAFLELLSFERAARAEE
jgi:cytochrome c peroxidase